MLTFLYKCPVTGYIVQGRVAEDDKSQTRETDNYEPLTCFACGRTHLVDPKNGKVLWAGQPWSRAR